MMAKILLAFTLLIFISWSDDLCRRNNSYLPLAVGNHWEYVDTLVKDGDYEHVRWDVLNDTLINDTSYFILRYHEHSPDDLGFLRQAKGITYERKPQNKAEHMLIPSVDSLGKSFVIRRDSTTSRVTLIAVDTTFTTPVKKYKALLCLKIESLAYSRIYFYFFQRGVGLVGIIDSKREFMRYLKSYHVK